MMLPALGLAITAIGAVVGFTGYFTKERGLDTDTATRMRDQQTGLGASVVMIGVALAIWYVLQTRHQARLGLSICIAILVLNAIVAHVLMLRGARAALDESQLARYRRLVTLEAAGLIAMFAGVYLYLTTM
jgi:multisubunit Na+/H+ antiporter MnhG subunit